MESAEQRARSQETDGEQTVTVTVPSEGGLAAKTISKIFKFVAAAGIILCAVVKWLGKMPDASAAEICMIWAAVYGIGAGTIDLNIMFDKFSGGRR